jgi:hypothetical protein
MAGYTGPPMFDGEPRDAGRAFDRPRADVAAQQGYARTPNDLREQASRLIDACDPEASLRAAALYLQAADRVFAESAYQFSEARLMADRAARDRAQAAVDRKRLDQELGEVDQVRQGLEVRRAALEGQESELMAREKALESLIEQTRARRRQAEAAPGPMFPDSGPIDLRPNPHTARTPVEFLQCLMNFRIWSGNRSLRQIAEQSDGRISASGVRNVLNGSELPERLEVVDAIVVGCGGANEDRADFAFVWRRLYMSPLDSTGADTPLSQGGYE